MITSTLVMPVIAVATAATIIYVGVGFLPRPSAASACWSTSLATAMIGSYVWMAQDFLLPPEMRAIGTALSIGPMPLLWSGLRAYRGRRRTFVPLSVAWLVGAPILLAFATDMGFYDIAFRVVFCSASVFAVLIVLELAGLGPRQRHAALPLMIVSGLFTVFAVITAINGVLVAGGSLSPSDALDFLRSLNMISMTVFILCTLVTVLLLTLRAGEHDRVPHRALEHVARTRLERAQASADPWWSVLEIRLDDTDDIHLSAGTAAFTMVTEKFAHDVDSVFPADADIEQIAPGRFRVLVPRPPGTVRELLVELLERVSAPEPGRPFPLRLSASVGWAAVTAVGYSFDALVRAASEAAVTAHESGGDRWERVHGASE